ncbi:MAG: hypothetical protein CBC42_00600 [Betaproteobacteria bacterium TMED82]|nr:MAG: hypothetical protein CBC42_00600 [Betaproteobacteria bacterium TMED82]|tara:strand:+ start:26947 stop:27573 length:627 start_codon:yes stop_codon:yes gene_type:complete
MSPSVFFDVNCKKCPRINKFLKVNRLKFPDYYNRPVPSIGPLHADLLVVGLAPGLHGGNATGQTFFGDFSGEFLFNTLYDIGFLERKYSKSKFEDYELINCRITNVCKCVPPKNRLLSSEIKNCSSYLQAEIFPISRKVIVCLGTVSHTVVHKMLGIRGQKFMHGKIFRIYNTLIFDSYHPSKLNVNTGVLTRKMLSELFWNVKYRLS